MFIPVNLPTEKARLEEASQDWKHSLTMTLLRVKKVKGRSCNTVVLPGLLFSFKIKSFPPSLHRTTSPVTNGRGVWVGEGDNLLKDMKTVSPRGCASRKVGCFLPHRII